MKYIIQQAYVSHEELEELVDKVQAALEGVERGKAITALISMSVIQMNPLISEVDLNRIVLEASRNMCLLVDGTGMDLQDESEGAVMEPEKVVLN